MCGRTQWIQRISCRPENGGDGGEIGMVIRSRGRGGQAGAIDGRGGDGMRGRGRTVVVWHADYSDLWNVEIIRGHKVKHYRTDGGSGKFLKRTNSERTNKKGLRGCAPIRSQLGVLTRSVHITPDGLHSNYPVTLSFQHSIYSRTPILSISCTASKSHIGPLSDSQETARIMHAVYGRQASSHPSSRFVNTSTGPIVAHSLHPYS